jgi:stage V sporulation protein AE
MTFLIAFLVGGSICALAQLVYDKSKLTPAHILAGLTVIGAVLTGIGVYEPFVKFAGAGALVPVSGFGSSVTSGVLAEVKRIGWEGLFTGVFEITGLGLATAVVFGAVSALFFRPKH